MTKKTNGIQRGIRGLLSLAIFWNAGAVSGAQAAEALWAERRRAAGRMALAAAPAGTEGFASRVEKGFPLELPTAKPVTSMPAPLAGWPLENVEIDRLWGGRPAVVLIKDLHAQEEAQRRIAAFIASLEKSGRRVVVGVEGAAGPLDFMPYRAFGEDETTKTLADAYLSWDWIQAAEYLGLTGSRNIRYVGVETPALYEAHVRAAKTADWLRPDLLKTLAKTDSALRRAQKEAFSPGQLRWEKSVRALQSGKIGLSAFVRLATDALPAARLRKEFPQTALFSNTDAAEKKLDFARAEKERREFLKALLRRLSPEDTASLELRALNFRQGGADAGDFHAALLESGRRAGMDPARYPAFKGYIDYARAAGGIERRALLTEMEKLESSVWESLSPTPRQNALWTLARDATLAEKLARLALTDGEWDRWSRRREDLSALPIRARAAGVETGEASLPLAPFEAFYTLAVRRDEALAANAWAARASDDETVVLVAGGFHADGAARWWRARAIPHLVATPRLENVDADKNSLAILTQGPAPLDRLLMGERIFLANRVSVGAPGAPRPGPGYAKTAAWPLLQRAARALRGTPVPPAPEPESGIFPLGIVHVKPGPAGESVDLTAKNRAGRNISMSLAPESAAAKSRGILPTALRLQDARGRWRSMVLLALPTGADRVEKMKKLILPSIDLLVMVGALQTAGNPWIALGAAFSFRAGWLLNSLMNEWGHVAAGIARGYGGIAFNLRNLRGNLPLKSLLQRLAPFSYPDGHDAFVQIDFTDKTDDRFIRRGGFWAGTALSLGALILAAWPAAQGPPAEWAVAAAYGLGALAAVLGGALTDLSRWTYYSSLRGIYACGNLGFIRRRGEREKKSLETVDRELFTSMGFITRKRGEQAAGAVVLTRSGKAPDLSRARVVNPKRADLPITLGKSMSKAAGAKGYAGIVQVAGHYRYGTSSAPAVKETHPHQWLPNRTAAVWSVVGGRPREDKRPVATAITHNGDFDAWKIFGRALENGEVGEWLGRVLNAPDKWKGDSPKVAGMMDLLLTQGQWDASARLAYQLVVAGSPDQKTPSPQTIKDWAARARVLFNERSERLFTPAARDLTDADEKYLPVFKKDLAGAFGGVEMIPREKAAAFADAMVEAFLKNDLTLATRKFMEGAVGSFGLVVTSALAPGRAALAARGQPLSIGFDAARGVVGWASDATALKAPFGREKKPFRHRWDLDLAKGEIAEVFMPTEGLPGFRLFSETWKREYTADELARSGRLIDMQDNPLISPFREEPRLDPVGSDLRDLPRVFKNIRRDWADADGLNRRTARAFIRGLLSRGPGARLVLTGVENSQWVPEEFARALRIALPGLNVRAESANKILAEDWEPAGSWDNLMILAVSQSGQTFPTLGAANLLKNRLPSDALFVMTGEADNLIAGQAAGQSYTRGADFHDRIFTSGAGRRTAEAAALTPAATHATFTELLLLLAKEGLARPDTALHTSLTETEIAKLHTFRDETADESVADIVGVTARGEKVDSTLNKSIARLGRRWADHVLEPALVFGMTASYLLASVGFSWPITPAAAIRPLVNGLPLPGTGFWPWLDKGLDWLPGLVDTGFYVFLFYFLTLALRTIQKRPLLTRTGKRTIVIGDVPWVHQLLESYVSKLGSLGYGIASVEVHGASPQDHMLHRFGHRVVRGTLLFLGRPDSRLPGLKSAENAVLMTGKQAKGVRHWNVGAEVVTVGHNPARSPNAADNEITLGTPSGVKMDALTEKAAALYESRFASLERLIAGYVFFHALFKKVSEFRPLRYDMSRSQSGTRVATTAAPVSAAEIYLQRDSSGPPVFNHVAVELPFIVPGGKPPTAAVPQTSPRAEEPAPSPRPAPEPIALAEETVPPAPAPQEEARPVPVEQKPETLPVAAPATDAAPRDEDQDPAGDRWIIQLSLGEADGLESKMIDLGGSPGNAQAFTLSEVARKNAALFLKSVKAMKKTPVLTVLLHAPSRKTLAGLQEKAGYVIDEDKFRDLCEKGQAVFEELTENNPASKPGKHPGSSIRALLLFVLLPMTSLFLGAGRAWSETLEVAWDRWNDAPTDVRPGNAATLPPLAPLLERLNPATLEAHHVESAMTGSALLWRKLGWERVEKFPQNLVNLLTPLPSDPRGKREAFAVQIKSGEDAGTVAAAQLLLREIVQRWGDERPSAPLFLVVEGPEKELGNAERRFREALETTLPDGSALTAAERAGLKIIAAPGDRFRVFGRTDANDGERLWDWAAGGGELTDARLTLLSLPGFPWRVDDALRDRVRAIEMFLPGVGRLITPELWDAWRKAVDTAA